MRYCVVALWVSALASFAAAADEAQHDAPAQLTVLSDTDVDWKCKPCARVLKPKRLSFIIPDLEEDGDNSEAEGTISGTRVDNEKIVQGIIHKTIENKNQNDNELELTEEEKRAWTNLHGGWGKRGWQDMSSAWGKRAWQDLNTAWGKRGWQDLNSAWGKRGWQDMSSAWGKRGWQDLNNAWGKRAWRDLTATPWGKRGWQDMSSAWGKRGWQDMSSAWGKRGWQDMSSAWGKRAPERWAQFHGAWGKRAAEPDYEDYEAAAVDQLIPLEQMSEADLQSVPEKKAWSALHGAWGKRPAKPHVNNNGAFYWKREPGWTNLRGMWGKRAYWEPDRAALDHEDAAKDEA